MKTEYQISGMRENGGLHEMFTEVPSLVAVKSPTANSGPNNNLIMRLCQSSQFPHLEYSMRQYHSGQRNLNSLNIEL